MEKSSASKQKPQASEPLSSDQQLAITREVENRLKNLPAETLKLIQREVDERIQNTERHYKQMATLAIACFALVCVAFFKVTWDTVTAKVATLIADTQVQRKIDDIAVSHRVAMDSSAKLNSTVAEFQQTEAALRNRLAELSKSDNLITYDESSGHVLLTPRNGGIKLSRKGFPNTYYLLTVNPQNGEYVVEQVHKGETNHIVSPMN